MAHHHLALQLLHRLKRNAHHDHDGGTAQRQAVEAGDHTLHLTLFGHRRNGFGPVHLTDLELRWIGPASWYSEGDCWAYDYTIASEGILTTPEVTLA